MKRLISFLILGFLIQGCWNDRSRQAANRGDTSDAMDTTTYPLVINGGTKIVYQFGYLTPDKGLKLYLDTISNPVGGLKLDDSVRIRISAE